MNRKTNITTQGFVALTVTLSVAGILLALVAASALESASFFDQEMKKEYRALNYYFAGDCLDQAMVMLAHDYFLAAPPAIDITDYHCSIVSIQIQSDTRTIIVVGNLQKALVYRRATVRLLNHGLDVIKIE